MASTSMESETTTAAENERRLILEAQRRGPLATLAAYVRLSGPGWLQGAITLGGGSLAGALYLGVITGYQLLWLQPLAMILGVVMLSAISYVALSTGERPFQAIKSHISPSLAWGWLIATMMANIVWCLPQFVLGTAAVQQNLLPDMTSGFGGKVVVAASILTVAIIVVWFYNSGNWGIRLFEMILKLLVGVVVLSFFGVVLAMTVHGALDWGKILAGLIPNFSNLFSPVSSLAPQIEAAGEFAGYWCAFIAGTQKDKIITAFATAVGINMTFLLPYSMLRKGWGRDHRGLAIFDLSIGLIVPYVLATSCVVIASASQFHGKSKDVLAMVEVGTGKEVKSYYSIVDKRLQMQFGAEFTAAVDEAKREGGNPSRLNQYRAELPQPERELAAALADATTWRWPRLWSPWWDRRLLSDCSASVCWVWPFLPLLF